MLEKLLPDKLVEKFYVNAGKMFGEAVSYIYMGECVGFEYLLTKWEKWEAEYARRGYYTVPIDYFIECGSYGKPLSGLRVKRSEGEKPIFHAKIYREVYFGKIPAVVNIAELTQSGAKPRLARYFLPSTKSK